MRSLLISHPPGYNIERRYIFNIIFLEFLGLQYQCREILSKEVRIQLIDVIDNGTLVWPDVLFRKNCGQWLLPFNLPITALPVWDVKKDLPDAKMVKPFIPVIYGEPIGKKHWFEQREDKSVIKIGLDIAGSAFFMLTCCDELVLPDRDEHGRFPAKASLAYREGFLDRPIVDEYVEILWACMKRLWPGLQRKKSEYRVSLSHDVDQPLGVVGKPWLRVIKAAGGDLVKRWDFELFAWRIIARARGHPELDPYNTFKFIMDVSERNGWKSTFFFKTGCSNPKFDEYYSLKDPWTRGLMRTIHERGHEIGLHPSYESYKDFRMLRAEYETLRRTADELGIFQEQWGSRQHYLRWENPTTWQILNAVGLDYDATLGFADHVGFRCGTCKEFPVFDLKKRQPMRLRERPLIVMDNTLLDSKYMGLSPGQTLNWIERLVSACRLYSGNLTLLWHNSSLLRGWQRRLYTELLEVCR